MDHRRLTVNQIANTATNSCKQVEKIRRKEFGLSKVSVLWVPRILTSDQKHTRLVMSQENLAPFEADPASFLERFLTQDECWVQHFETETKRQSMQWIETPLISPSIEGQGGVVAREGDGLHLLGCKGHYVHCLPLERRNNQRRLLRQLAEAAAKGYQIQAIWKSDEGGPNCFIKIMLLLTSRWLQSFLCLTVALNWLITPFILLVWHHPTISSSQAEPD